MTMQATEKQTLTLKIKNRTEKKIHLLDFNNHVVGHGCPNKRNLCRAATAQLIPTGAQKKEKRQPIEPVAYISK